MPRGCEVRPRRWTEVEDLFDNGDYSAIWGRYRHDDEIKRPRCLGVRWNGDEQRPLGYPVTRRYPQWHVEPDFLTEAILQSLRQQAERIDYANDSQKHIANIDAALVEFRCQPQ